MTEATLRLEPVKGRVGHSRQVPAVVIKPEDRLKTLDENIERAFKKYHRRGLVAQRVLQAVPLRYVLVCEQTENVVGEVLVIKVEDE